MLTMFEPGVTRGLMNGFNDAIIAPAMYGILNSLLTSSDPSATKPQQDSSNKSKTAGKSPDTPYEQIYKQAGGETLERTNFQTPTIIPMDSTSTAASSGGKVVKSKPKSSGSVSKQKATASTYVAPSSNGIIAPVDSTAGTVIGSNVQPSIDVAIPIVDETAAASANAQPIMRTGANPDTSYADVQAIINQQNADQANYQPIMRTGANPDTPYAEVQAIANGNVNNELIAQQQADMENKYQALLKMYGIAPDTGYPKVDPAAAQAYYTDPSVYEALQRSYSGAPMFNAWG